MTPPSHRGIPERSTRAESQSRQSEVERPLLFLDVDGVIAVYGIGLDYDAMDEVHIGHQHLWVPQRHRDRLARLAESFDIVWATAWLGGAHTSWRLHLALPDVSWPYVDYRDYKLTEIVRYAGERRWAWVDDDAKWELRGLGWTPGRHFDGLVLNPDPKVGLTDEHVSDLLEYAAAAA